ncbi:MAG: lipopolysaccharide heptosyltransferase I [Phycisphaerae bacterium]|nr:lipopolysaccharide heptosyltransferase I [Phycisphaerae bacterium]
MTDTVPDDRRQYQRILIIKPSSLGDIVHALPILAGLRAGYPGAHIAWLVGKSFAPFLAGHPLLDEVIPFDRRHYGRMLRSPRALADFWRFVRELRRRRFDLVLDLQGLFRSGFLARASGAPRRIGFADAREFAPAFYSRRVRGSRKNCHAVEINLRLARSLGLHVDPPLFPLGLRDDELRDTRNLITEAARMRLERFTAVLLGARWESKRWPADRLAGLIDKMHAEGLPACVLLGSPDDRVFAEEVRAGCGAPIVDLVGRTSLRELTAAIALADLVVSHDSGPLHIAAALDKPLVALFGPTNPARTGPYCKSARVVSLPLECVPCYRRQCPLGHHKCMQQLDVEAVFQNVLEIWAPISKMA